MVCCDGVHDDLVGPQSRTAVETFQGTHQSLVTAPVNVKGGNISGDLDRFQVGHDVGAAEGIDRLLGITDENQRHRTVEGGGQDVPLQRICVLEFVDQGDPVARPDPILRDRPVDRIGERVAQQH